MTIDCEMPLNGKGYRGICVGMGSDALRRIMLRLASASASGKVV